MLAAALCSSPPAPAASIVGSRHDIGASGTAHLCEFCHAPDASEQVLVPAWSRLAANPTFALYGTPAVFEITPMNAPGHWPGATTRLCLSCHDDINATAVLYGDGEPLGIRHHPADRSGERDVPQARPSVRGTSLISGHPVFVRYPMQPLPVEFHVPPLPDAQGGAAGEMKLVGGMVECVSCHNVHDPTFRPFLRRSNAGSAMCMSCHKR